MNNIGCKGYILGPERIKENIIIISGTSRAGKTLLSKVLASHSNVEWIEEPYEIFNPLIMCGLGLLDRSLFDMFFTSYVHEIIVNNILLRSGNFRPNDLSSVWNYKSGKDIFYRLHTLESRSDVEKYIEQEHPYFILDLPEILPFTGIVRDLCENISVINVVRNAYDVADDCFRKGWFAADDSLLADNNLFRVHEGRKLPWWVHKGEEDRFIGSSLYEKGLFYWLGIQAWERDTTSDLSKYDLYVRYEDMVRNIDDVLGEIGRHIDIKPTTITNAVKSEIVEGYNVRLDEREKPCDSTDRELLSSIMSSFGY